MKWQTALAGALASAVLTCMVTCMTSTAFADVRIVGDPGGEVDSYIRKFNAIRDSGERIVVDGPCLSACTLFTGIVPRDRVCVTRRAALGFHAASYYDDASRSLIPTRRGSALVMRLYPAQIRSWIAHHGGLRPQMIVMRGRELSALYPTCQ